jgi:hypothetical protein
MTFVTEVDQYGRGAVLVEDARQREDKLRRFLLTAAMLLAYGSAAHARPAQMPTELVGSWCFENGNSDGFEIYSRGDFEHGKDCSIGMNFRQHTYDGNEFNCSVLKAERMEKVAGYLIRASCEGERQSWVENLAIHLSGDQILITRQSQH